VCDEDKLLQQDNQLKNLLETLLDSLTEDKVSLPESVKTEEDFFAWIRNQCNE